MLRLPSQANQAMMRQSSPQTQQIHLPQVPNAATKRPDAQTGGSPAMGSATSPSKIEGLNWDIHSVITRQIVDYALKLSIYYCQCLINFFSS